MGRSRRHQTPIDKSAGYKDDFMQDDAFDVWVRYDAVDWRVLNRSQSSTPVNVNDSATTGPATKFSWLAGSFPGCSN
jgi:hypothetical protein